MTLRLKGNLIFLDQNKLGDMRMTYQQYRQILDKAFEDGYNDQRSGKKRLDNRYKGKDISIYNAWLSGWMQSRDEVVEKG